ncbi:MAG: polysaccharide biosynthesis protein [Phycisphaerales bacterium]|nr:polysaccharide biosynthesis protein [Phycisphaerales bacterium]
MLQRLKNSLMARNLAVPYVRMVIQLLSGLILTPVLLDHVGKESYALWALAAMILGWFGVLEMGIGGAVQRFLAGSFATGDRDSIAKQFNTGLAISCLLSAIIAGAVLACLVPVSSAMTDTTEQAAELRLLLAYLLVALVITMQTGLFATVLTARERFVPVGLVGMGVEIARLVLFLVMLLRFDASIVDLAIANAGLELVNLLAVAFVGRLLVGLPPIGLRYLDVSRTGMMLAGFAGWSLFITVSYILRARVDLAVAKLFVGFETVAIFAVGSTLAARVEGIVSQFGGPYTSRLSRLHSLGDREGVIEQYYRGSVVQESIAMVCGVGMIVFAPAFMRLWIGDRLATEGSQGDPLADATLVMQILAWGWFLGLYGGLIGPLMRAWNRMRMLSLLIFTEGVLNLALSLLFVLRFEWGLAGIAAGTAVAAVLVRTIASPWFACRTMAEPLRRYWLRLQGPILVIGAVGVLVGWAIRPNDWIDNWFVFFVAAGVFGCVLLAATCVLPSHPLLAWYRHTKRDADMGIDQERKP